MNRIPPKVIIVNEHFIIVLVDVEILIHTASLECRQIDFPTLIVEANFCGDIFHRKTTGFQLRETKRLLYFLSASVDSPLPFLHLCFEKDIVSRGNNLQGVYELNLIIILNGIDSSIYSEPAREAFRNIHIGFMRDTKPLVPSRLMALGALAILGCSAPRKSWYKVANICRRFHPINIEFVVFFHLNRLFKSANLTNSALL